MGNHVYKEFYPYVMSKIKEHQKDFDPENPRDYLDFLLIEEKTNENVGWHSMIFTMFRLKLKFVIFIKFKIPIISKALLKLYL